MTTTNRSATGILVVLVAAVLTLLVGVGLGTRTHTVEGTSCGSTYRPDTDGWQHDAAVAALVNGGGQDITEQCQDATSLHTLAWLLTGAGAAALIGCGIAGDMRRRRTYVEDDEVQA